MIDLTSPLQLDVKTEVAHLVLWCCAPFDESYSFRVTLESIDKILSRDGASYIELPEGTAEEDFVSGRLTWNGLLFDVYFERSLGDLEFSSPTLSSVEALRAALKPHVQVDEDL